MLPIHPRRNVNNSHDLGVAPNGYLEQADEIRDKRSKLDLSLLLQSWHTIGLFKLVITPKAPI